MEITTEKPLIRSSHPTEAMHSPISFTSDPTTAETMEKQQSGNNMKRKRLQYTREQMLKIREDPICKVKPSDLPTELISETRGYTKPRGNAALAPRASKRPSTLFTSSSSSWETAGKGDRRGKKPQNVGANGNNIEDRSEGTRPIPKQAAWFNEKVKKVGASLDLEPNPDELTQSERERRNAFEEFRRQHAKKKGIEHENVSEFGTLPAFFNDEEPVSTMLPPSKEKTQNISQPDSNSFLVSDDLIIGEDEDEFDKVLSMFPLRNKSEHRAGSKFFSTSNSTQNNLAQNGEKPLPHQQQAPQEKSRFVPEVKSEQSTNNQDISFEDESQLLMKDILETEIESKSNVPSDPLQAIFAKASQPVLHIAPQATPPFPPNINNNMPPMEFTYASNLEQELLGRGVSKSTMQQPVPGTNWSSNDNVYAKLPQAQQLIPNGMGNQFPLMGPQPAFISQRTQQYINPYQQYVQAQQFLKQSQEQMMMQQQQRANLEKQPPQQNLEQQRAPVKEENKESTIKAKPAMKQNQFVPPQISKSIGKTIKPKKQSATVTKKTGDASSEIDMTTNSQQQQLQQQQQPQPLPQYPIMHPSMQHPHMQQPHPIQHHLHHMPYHPRSNQQIAPPIIQPILPQQPPMNPDYMMHMQPMYNNMNLPQWFAGLPQQGPMNIPTGDILSAEDLEKNIVSK